jgi:hypothetical protein
LHDDMDLLEDEKVWMREQCARMAREQVNKGYGRLNGGVRDEGY